MEETEAMEAIEVTVVMEEVMEEEMVEAGVETEVMVEAMEEEMAEVMVAAIGDCLITQELINRYTVIKNVRHWSHRMYSLVSQSTLLSLRENDRFGRTSMYNAT